MRSSNISLKEVATAISTVYQIPCKPKIMLTAFLAFPFRKIALKGTSSSETFTTPFRTSASLPFLLLTNAVTKITAMF